MLLPATQQARRLCAISLQLVKAGPMRQVGESDRSIKMERCTKNEPTRSPATPSRRAVDRLAPGSFALPGNGSRHLGGRPRAEPGWQSSLSWGHRLHGTAVRGGYPASRSDSESSCRTSFARAHRGRAEGAPADHRTFTAHQHSRCGPPQGDSTRTAEGQLSKMAASHLA